MFLHLMLNEKLFWVVIFDKEIFYKNQPIRKDMHLFFLNILSLSLGNSDNKCLKWLSCKFPAQASKEAFKN